VNPASRALRTHSRAAAVFAFKAHARNILAVPVSFERHRLALTENEEVAISKIVGACNQAGRDQLCHELPTRITGTRRDRTGIITSVPSAEIADHHGFLSQKVPKV
jgi:hypothetical protein